MSFQDVTGLFVSAKALSESFGVDPQVVSLLVTACVALVVFTRVCLWTLKTSLTAVREVVSFVLPGDELRDEILATLRGKRGQVVANPAACEILTERMTLGHGCERGRPRDVLFVKADGQYQPLKALSVKARAKIVAQVRKLVAEHERQSQLVARENFLNSIRPA